MHQDYDKILKENIKKAEQTILTCVCGLPNLLLEELPRDVPRTIERRADWLKIGLDTTTFERKLYQIEFQAVDDPEMPLRMLIYWGLYSERYKLPVEQYVVHIGEKNSLMPNYLKRENIWFEYKLISINTIDYELFLAADTPESIILAILADFKKENNIDVVGKILVALQNKAKNQRALQKYIYQMELLANLRELQPLISHQITKMSINYDLSKDFRYNQGKTEGEAQGASLASIIIKRYTRGGTPEQIAQDLKTDLKFVKTVIAQFESEDNE
jgi:hypothetical protein